jgi:hypothetical protein
MEKGFSRRQNMQRYVGIALLCMVLLALTACKSSEKKGNLNEEMAVSTVEATQSETENKETEQPKSEIGFSETVRKEEGETESDKENKKSSKTGIKIQVGDIVFTATLEENSSVDALKELLKDGPLTLNMSDYANMEKGGDLGITLPQNNEPMNTQAGDIILYQGRTLVIYYDTNSWSLTPIGKIDNAEEEELLEALGMGDVTVILSLEEE